MEGRDGVLLGRLLDFLKRIFRLADSLNQPCSPRKWQKRLMAVLDQFFPVDTGLERELQQIRQALETLGHMETVGSCDRELPLEVVAAYLEKSFQHRQHASGFLSGAVTFCAMLPMRSIPFKIVCMVGMNNDTFPRNQQPLGFDLIRLHPQPGDRSRRNDDKYLFLEAIMSARRLLYISYVGQSIEDNTPIPPSVLVSELLDYLSTAFGAKEESIVVRHPLQAFSPRYFQDAAGFPSSYSRENFEAVSSRGQDRAPAAFFTGPLPEPSPDRKRLSIDQLCRFFQHPVRFLLQQRLGLHLEQRTAPEQDREPFQLDPLTRYRIGQQLSEQILSGSDPSSFLDVHNAIGHLPQGSVGEKTFRDMQSEIEELTGRVRSELQTAAFRQRAIDLKVADFSLSGVLTDLYPHGRIQYRFAQMRAADIVTGWIRHLCLGLMTDEHIGGQTTLVGTDGSRILHPVENPAQPLAELLQIYWQGLHEPLHFFPELSYDYYQLTSRKGRTQADAIQALRRKWKGDDYRRGELDDPYVRLCFERSDPFENAFRQLAVSIFGPIFGAKEKTN